MRSVNEKNRVCRREKAIYSWMGAPSTCIELIVTRGAPGSIVMAVVPVATRIETPAPPWRTISLADVFASKTIGLTVCVPAATVTLTGMPLAEGL